MKNERLLSLDALRGFDMLLIMGLGYVVAQLCAVCGFGSDCWLARQFLHEEWNGLRLEDTIFPLFLFLAGVAWPFSHAKQVARGVPRSRIVLRCLRRAAILFLLGLVYGGLLSGTVRPGSVLGRIGIAWAFGAILHAYCRPRTLLALALALPIGYWWFLCLVPAPDAATLVLPGKLAFVESYGRGPFSIIGNFSGWLDRTYRFGILSPYPGIMDNQSILGYIPATGTALLGILTGDFVRRTRGTLSDGRRIAMLFASAAALTALGLWIAHGFGSCSMPINKKLWSASFTFVVGGYSLALFALFHGIVDVLGWTRWTFFFRVIGMNSITIYLAMRFIPFSTVARNLLGGVASVVPPDAQGVILGTGTVAVEWLFLYFLYRKQTFLRV